jgi:PilZ domain
VGIAGQEILTSDRRRNPRIQILGNFHGRVVALELPVVVTEISLGGMAIQTDIQFPVGSIHEFQLTLGDDSVVVLKGKVAHCQKAVEGNQYLSGIQFIDDPADDSEK